MSETHQRSAYIWNTASGLLNAFQSVIMLMVLTRVCDVATAGVFTLAYANANLFLNLGKYGVRNYQVSDVEGRFGFAAYLRSRVITVAAMIVFGGAYALWQAVSVGWGAEKTAIVIVMLVFKAVDAIEDVYHGNYQQHGRLDVGAKVLTCRMLTMIVTFAVLVVTMGELLFPLAIATILTALFFVAETLWARRFGLPVHDSAIGPSEMGGHGSAWREAAGLLRECFPVFLAAFLLFYIGNAPKYAIDGAMDDAAQAYYGYIAMPVFVVGLLASFVYNPIVASLAEDWAEGRVAVFVRRIGVQALVILGITFACMAGAWVCGVPVLGLLYNADLGAYKPDLLVLLAGGGFLALVSLLTMAITIMRRQGWLIPGYVAVAALAAVGSPLAVEAAGVAGAAWIYLALMAVLAIWFTVTFAMALRKGR